MATKLRIYRNYRRSHYEIATLGAVGATLSHARVWDPFLKSGEDEKGGRGRDGLPQR